MSNHANYLDQITRIHQELGIPSTYAQDRHLNVFEEAASLVTAEHDANGRQHRLITEADHMWKLMKHEAAKDGLQLIMVSGYRSVEYQTGLIKRKLEQGKPIEEILKVLAAPGFSEHHTGRAIDLTSPDCPPCEEKFEKTDAFAWLNQHAREYNFVMSFPRDNRHGFIYEPWHWAYHSTGDGFL
ncbi:MAG: M15 family metallopeptidase [Gammaproteobacteria bacterium]|jgi:D-alanyl-D-alanine carboxypeptidase